MRGQHNNSVDVEQNFVSAEKQKKCWKWYEGGLGEGKKYKSRGGELDLFKQETVVKTTFHTETQPHI